MAKRLLELQQGRTTRQNRRRALPIDGPLSNWQILSLFLNPDSEPSNTHIHQLQNPSVQASPDSHILRSEAPRSVSPQPNSQQTHYQSSPQLGENFVQPTIRSPIRLLSDSPESSHSSPNSVPFRKTPIGEGETDPRLSFAPSIEATKRLVKRLKLDVDLESEPGSDPTQTLPRVRASPQASPQTEAYTFTHFDREPFKISHFLELNILDTDPPHMPYNNATIFPPDDISGSATLPCEYTQIFCMKRANAHCSSGSSQENFEYR